MKNAYYHEDDFCQIEMQPVENMIFIQQQITNINDFSKEHIAENGIGWTDVYLRPEFPIKLIDKKIKIEDIEKSLDANIEKFERVYSGYSSEKIECKHTIAYGNEKVKVFFSYEGIYVKNIWFDYLLNTHEVADLLFSIIEIIISVEDLIFVDWCGEHYSHVKNDPDFKNYLIQESEYLPQNRKAENNKIQKKWWEFWR